MARARNIKPSTMANDTLAECEPITRLLFIYLWMLADREGRLEDRPKRIAAEALPYDRVDADAMLDELAERGFILRYSVGGTAYIQILAFHKHQNPHSREAQSEIPPPHGATKAPPDCGGATPRHGLGNAFDVPSRADSLIPDSPSLIPDPPSGTEGGAAQARPATDPPPRRQARGSKFCPDDFEPDDELIGWARREHPTVDIAGETELFRDHEFAKPRSDWRRAWRGWIRRAETFNRTTASRQSGRESTAEHNDRAFDEWMAGTDDGRTIDA